MLTLCLCVGTVCGVAGRAPGRPVEDSREAGGRLSGDQDHAGQTPQICRCGPGIVYFLNYGWH